MERVKTKHKNKHNIVLNKAQMKRINRLTSNIATTQALCLFIAYVMEETEIDCNEDKIMEIFDGVNAWASAIDDHLISLKTVADIIEKKSGIKVRW